MIAWPATPATEAMIAAAALTADYQIANGTKTIRISTSTSTKKQRKIKKLKRQNRKKARQK